ncbi:MAG: Mu transposase C-terminal domain-containing protein [Candidatus Gastranaerophilales bacterium]|nr:Mu transposase C-terminal domain-containing protein [Candidatus Gastranaerophilales bacterium]
MEYKDFEPSIIQDDKYITIKELAELKGVSTRAIRLAKLKYKTQEIKVQGGNSFEILISSIEPELQEKYLDKKVEIKSESTSLVPINFKEDSTDKAKETALARFDLLKEWQRQRKNQRKQTKFDTDFLDAYNAGLLYPKIYSAIGNVSIGTLQRWKRILSNSSDFRLLIPNYHYPKAESKTSLTDFEKQIFMKFLLHPNKFSIGKAISLTQYILEKNEQNYIPSNPTFRRFANWYRDNNYDKWILLRDGEKSLKEEVIPHIKRDLSKIEVGDVLVADGKKLNFQVINPFTGKPCRATLIGFLDWKSTALVGYEIMLEENTQNIASALRNAILNLGKIPKFVYQDNGRAFRAKYFIGSADFQETGIRGIYEKLGITPIFANPYNARAKVIERFFLEMQESFEKLLPSYIGTSIENKPARLKRNEKFHSENHREFVPTIEQTIQMIESWLEYKNSLLCPNDKAKTIKEMLAGIEKQEISEQCLDDLMMAQEIKTITSQGIRFLKAVYFDDALYGLRQKVMIKYSLFDLSYIKVYTINGKFLCKAEQITLTHPLAHYTGEIKDIEDYKQKIQKKKQLKNKTIKACKEFLNVEDLDVLKCKLIEEREPIVEKTIGGKIGDFSAPEETKNEEGPKIKLLFKTNFERYEHLMKNGCTCNVDRKWLSEYKNTEECKIYEKDFC